MIWHNWNTYYSNIEDNEDEIMKIESSFLEKICDISNTYEIVPKKVIKIYNKAVKKDYIDSALQGLTLTKRYVSMHYALREEQSREWGYDQIIAFNKYKRE
jgi:hypothetical protein